MPFVAKMAGDIVLPEEVEDDARATCLDCGGVLRIRQSHERSGTFVARHFYHPNGGGGCSGGESPVHRRMKSIALSKVKQVFPCEEVGLEEKIGDKIADLYATFEDPVGKFGDGIVVEVQHKNEGKDIEQTNLNYLRNGYSVCWISTEALRGQDIDFSDTDWRYAGKFDEPEPNTISGPDSDGVDGVTYPPKSDVYPTCPRCFWDPTLEPVAREHAYESGQVYLCEDCNNYFIEVGDFWEESVRGVAHEGNLTPGDSQRYLK